MGTAYEWRDAESPSSGKPGASMRPGNERFGNDIGLSMSDNPLSIIFLENFPRVQLTDALRQLAPTDSSFRDRWTFFKFPFLTVRRYVR